MLSRSKTGVIRLGVTNHPLGSRSRSIHEKVNGILHDTGIRNSYLQCSMTMGSTESDVNYYLNVLDENLRIIQPTGDRLDITNEEMMLIAVDDERTTCDAYIEDVSRVIDTLDRAGTSMDLVRVIADGSQQYQILNGDPDYFSNADLGLDLSGRHTRKEMVFLDKGSPLSSSALVVYRREAFTGTTLSYTDMVNGHALFKSICEVDHKRLLKRLRERSESGMLSVSLIKHVLSLYSIITGYMTEYLNALSNLTKECEG